MAIGRPQMEEQIKGFAEAGEVESVTDTSNIDDQAAFLRQAFADALQEERKRNPSAFLRQPQPPDPRLVEEYNQMLKQNFGSSKKSNIFDLASTLGASMSAADPTTGAFRSLGQGFSQFNLEEKKRRQQENMERKQLALKAFELAKSDTDAAIQMMNEYEIAIAKQNPDNEFKKYYVEDPRGITVASVYYPPGSFASLTNREASGLRGRVRVTTGGGVKVPNTSSVVTYMTKENAEKMIESLGLKPGSPNFDMAVNRITAPSELRQGSDIIFQGKYMELQTIVEDGIVTNVVLTPSNESVQPAFEIVRRKRLELIAKNQDGYTEKQIQVIPTVERAMQQLLSGTETGLVQETFLGFRKLINGLFKTSDPGLAILEDIVAISNYLAPKMRPVGSGSTSDMEFKAYQNAILSLGKTPEANYIALYAFKKMTENSIRNNQKELELLADSSVTDMSVVNDELKAIDRGIFEKLPEGVDPNDDEAVKAWYDSLPSGAVIDNATVKIIDLPTPFIIKDFGLIN
jgi:hypothetical protein